MKFLREKESQQSEVLSPVAVYSRVLQDRIGLGIPRIPTVVAHKQVFDRESAPELVPPHKEVVRGPDGHILIGLAIHQFYRNPRRKEPDRIDQIFEFALTKAVVRSNQVVISDPQALHHCVPFFLYSLGEISFVSPQQVLDVLVIGGARADVTEEGT